VNPNHLFRHVPRRALNTAVVLGGLIGIILQANYHWTIVTTFLITLAICLVCAGLAALIFLPRRK
jgi:protein-S-isoprenylcysteine O-methyltransferase Ste14